MEKQNVLDTQVGGNHYQHFTPQPMEWFSELSLKFIHGNILKYILRYPFKNGKEDLQKAKHYLGYLRQYADGVNHQVYDDGLDFISQNENVLNSSQILAIQLFFLYLEFGNVRHLECLDVLLEIMINSEQ